MDLDFSKLHKVWSVINPDTPDKHILDVDLAKVLRRPLDLKKTILVVFIPRTKLTLDQRLITCPVERVEIASVIL